MLSVLHNQIEKIVPINGVSQNFDGTIEIFYVETPSEQQLIEVNEIISAWPFEKKKLEKLAKIDAEWDQTIAQGWDSGQGILGISANDVALLSANFSLAKEAANLGYPIPPIITLNDQEIVFSDIQSLTMFMLQYGEYRSSLSKTFASRRRAVADATTLAQVDEA